MKDHPLDITSFLKLVLEALEASRVEYMIGGAVAEWAWGEPRIWILSLTSPSKP